MMKDPQFMLHNYHLESPKLFYDRDPQLRALKKQKYAYLPPLIAQLPKDIPGIYTIGGGRQIGKSTLSKQWMAHLLTQGIPPKTIRYFTGETIFDHFSLIRQLQSYIEEMPEDKLKYIVVDEVTYIQNWDMGIKFLADAGLFEKVILVITGSDLVIMQEARMRFPGRRGQADQVDFHIHPLSFYEVLKLTNTIENLDDVLQKDTPCETLMTQLNHSFKEYLQHGGFLTAINDFSLKGKIDKNTLNTYADWIRGDLLKRGKTDHDCREFFTAMMKRLNSQVTWTALSKDFSIEHHKTIADYAALLMSMDAIFVQQALIEDKLIGAPKKARKLIFTDPFIYHAIYAWLTPSKTPFVSQIAPSINNPTIAAYLVESCIASHIHRWYPTYYIKAEGEVDVAYIKNNAFWPIEVKWTQQLRTKDLKQIQKYPNGIILSKQQRICKINSTTSYPLPWYLAKMAYKHADHF